MRPRGVPGRPESAVMDYMSAFDNAFGTTASPPVTPATSAHDRLPPERRGLATNKRSDEAGAGTRSRSRWGSEPGTPDLPRGLVSAAVTRACISDELLGAYRRA